MRDGSPSRPDGSAAAVEERSPFLALVAVVSAAVVQEPLLGNFFYGDDWMHLYQIVDHGFVSFAATPHGGHMLVTSNTAFYLCHWLFGLDAGMYNAVALLTHLLNVYLLYRLVEESGAGEVLAFVAALAWGISGLNQGTLGWFSVYGHALAATFLLAFLGDVARIARRRRAIGGWVLARWIGLLMLSATSFGTGLAAALLAAPTAWLLLDDPAGRRRALLGLGTLTLALPALYVGLQWVHAQMPGSVDAASTIEGYRSMLDPSLLGSALWLLAMTFSYGLASLLLGPLVTAWEDGAIMGPLSGLSLNGLLPLCLGLAAGVLAGCAAALRRASPAERRRVAAYGLLILGCYGMIAVARAGFFRFLGYSFAHAAIQPRYQYVAQALIAVLLVFSVAAWRLPRLRPGWRSRAVVLALLIPVLVLGRLSSILVHNLMPSGGRSAYEETVSSLREIILSSPPGSDVFIANQRTPDNFPQFTDFAGLAAVFIIGFPSNEFEGRRVYFVEADARRRRELVAHRPDTRLARLLTAPPDREAAPAPGAEERVAPPEAGP